MEHSLTSAELWKEAAKNKRLNPYSNGTLSDLVFYAITAMAFLS